MLKSNKWKTDSTEQIADVCHRLYDRNYLVATSGNISIRTDDGFLITPAMTRKDAVEPSMIVSCDGDGNAIDPSKRPSSEIAMHSEIYAVRSDINAAIHAHPHYCLACSVMEIPMTDILLPELAIYVGQVPLVPYATPGTIEMAETLLPLLPKHESFLLQRHGVLVLGENLEEAFNRLEHLEHMARIAYLVNSMGSIEPLTKAELRKLTEHARSLGRKISETILNILD